MSKHYAKGGEVEPKKDSPFSVEVWKSKSRYNSNKPSLDKEVKTYSEALEIALSSIEDGAYKSQIMSKQGYLWEVDEDGVQSYAKGGITKAELKLNIYEPSGDYFMEKKGGKIILHLTSKDASNLPPSFFERYNVEDNGKGYYGTSYVVSKKYAKGGSVKGGVCMPPLFNC